MVDQTTFRKKRSIALFILAGLLLVFFLGIFLLPSLVSTDWGENKIKQIVNGRLPGQVDFDNLSLSWFNIIQCQGITYDNRAEGILVKVADVTISKGLLALAINHKEIGEMNISEPLVSFYLDEKSGHGQAGTEPSSEKQEPKITGTAPPQPAENNNGIILPPIEGKLTITGGTVTAVYPDLKEKPVVKDLKFQLNFGGVENPMDYLVDFQSGDGTGQVKGKGAVTLPAGDIAKLDEIQSQAVLDIENWEITDLLSILATAANVPTGSGLLNGHMSISGSTATALQITGNLNAQQVKLQGGPLKSDTPFLDSVVVEVDGEKTGSIVTIKKLVLTSPMAAGTASGTFDDRGHKKEIVSQAVIDLAQLSAQFPSTLNLKKGIRISEGKIDLNAKVTATDKTTLFDTSAGLDKLQGVAGKKKLVWDKPVKLEARGEQSPAGLKLENFIVQSAFLNGKGQGDINHMKVELVADIGLALEEVGKFIQLEGWKSDGKMELNLQVDTKTESLRAVVGEVSIIDFVLQHKDRVIAPRDSLKTNLLTDLRLGREMRPKEMLDTTLDFQSWAGSGAVTMKNFNPPSDQIGAQVKDLDFKGTFDLDHLTALLQTLDVLPTDSRLAGKTDLNTRLSMKDNMVELGGTSMAIRDFLFQNSKQKFSEKEIVLTTSGSVDLKGKTATLKPFELKTTMGHMAFPELAVTNWDQLKNGVKTNGSIDLDLGPLTALLGDVIKLPPATTVAGPAAIKLNIDLTDGQQQFVQLDGAIGPVEVSSKNKPPFSEDSIRLAMNLKGDLFDQNFTFSNVELSTLPLSIGASGKVAPDREERMLTVEGYMALDLKALSSYLKSFADLDLEMSGAVKRPFAIKAKSTNGQWVEMPKHTELSASFYADTIRASGAHIELLEVGIGLADSLVEIDIQGKLNRGKMALKPTIDFKVDPPVISIPENTMVLTGVELTDSMSGDHLAKVHPLFHGSVISQGTVDLDMQHFSWPLDKAARKDATFTSSLIFHDVKLQAGGLINELLAIMKANEREITLSDQPMECVGKNDRVLCSPLEIQTKDYSLMLTGSVGFDQSLDYKVQVPVTRKMVGGDVYKYLEGTFITVPISGTVSHPSLSHDFVQDAIKDLIIQAGKKEITEQAGKLLQKLFQ